jgi:hypothetical protein
MKRLTIQILITGLGCLIIGLSLIGVVFHHYNNFNSLPQLPVTRETINSLKDLYFTSEFELVPVIGLFLAFVGIVLVFIYVRLKKLNKPRQPWSPD